MISFTSFPLPRLYAPRVDVVEDALMDLDDDQDLLEASGSKLTYPGEPLTSSQLYMRYVRFIGWCRPAYLDITFQRSWNVY
jgi:hypothetical protein